jgi:hypothetical protein
MRSCTVDITVRAKIHVPKKLPTNYKHLLSEVSTLLRRADKFLRIQATVTY